MLISEFELLIAEHGKSVYGFIRKLTQNAADADDLYQQTFLKAFEMLEQIDSERYPKAFLLSLALGIYRNSLRKERRRQEIAPTFAITEDNEELLPSDTSVEHDLMQREEARLVAECISELDEKYRIPILLYYNAELRTEEIARVMKKPVGTVKSRLKKARELLKQRMEEKGYER